MNEELVEENDEMEHYYEDEVEKTKLRAEEHVPKFGASADNNTPLMADHK